MTHNKVPVTWQTLNMLRLRAEEARDPDAMRKVARLFEMTGRHWGAMALREKARKWEKRGGKWHGYSTVP